MGYFKVSTSSIPLPHGPDHQPLDPATVSNDMLVQMARALNSTLTVATTIAADVRLVVSLAVVCNASKRDASRDLRGERQTMFGICVKSKFTRMCMNACAVCMRVLYARARACTWCAHVHARMLGMVHCCLRSNRDRWRRSDWRLIRWDIYPSASALPIWTFWWPVVPST